MHQLTDSYGRKMYYPRFSVADRCNFRRRYFRFITRRDQSGGA